MTEQYVTYELDGDIALLGISRVAKRNALNTDVVNQLVDAALRAGREARAGVIFGHGEHFCAGLDLVAASERHRVGVTDDWKRGRHDGHLGFDSIARGRIPFVASLQGAVIGYGVELAAATQIRVADRSAYFGLPEAMRGIFVGGGGSVRIQRLVGYPCMADMMLTQRILSADEASEKNLCQYVVDEGEALDKAKEIARKMAKNVALSNWTVCNVLPRMMEMSHDDGFMFEQMAAAYTFGDESQERLEQFVNKRSKAFKP